MSTFDPDKKRLTRITASPMVTPFLRDEVASLGFEVQDIDHVGVHTGATLAECMRLNLHLRTGLHVMWLLARFRCPSPKALYTQIAAFPWEELIPLDGYFSVSSHVDHPKITNSMYPNLVVKDAVVDRISGRLGSRPNSGSDRSRLVLNLYWKGDRAWVYLNTTGRRLADRGYRKMPHSAPMQETLAAAVLMASGYDGTVPLVNPMCGSGTLAIEAALIAADRAPGLLRSNYSFMHTKPHDPGAWRAIRAEARKRGRAGPIAPIIASDIDPRAIDAARSNAKTAGVEHLIEFVTCDFADTPMPETRGGQVGAGVVIMNPEYGLRLGQTGDLETLYTRIGDYFKQRCPGWHGCVFTGNRDLAKRIGLRTARRTPFMNATIECRLLEYELYEGSERRS